MAESQSNARLRATAGAPTSGVIHIRTRLTADFTVISNALAQRRGSAVTVGVAAYILSLPDGSPVSIGALCEHFTEGEILVSRALRELEEAGYLERRRERLPSGQIRTRTYFYDVPRADPGPGTRPGPGGSPPGPPKPRRPRKGRPAAAAATPTLTAEPEPEPETTTGTGTGTATAQEPAQASAKTPTPLADADPQAVAVLTALRRVDPRLILSGQEAARLAPAVAHWLAAGVGAPQITELLTARLPDHFLVRPAGILAFRLRETPLPAPPSPTHPAPTDRPTILPFQTCDGCDRAFRAPQPGRCQNCRSGSHLRAAG